MRRFLTLTAVLLSLTMILALCACGGEETTEPETDPTGETETVDPSGSENAEGTETTEPVQTAGADLEALKAQIIADCGITDYIDVPAENLAGVYNLDAAQIVNAAAFNAMAGGAFPEEVVMVQAVDEAAAAAIAGQLEARLASIAEQAASYDPVSLELAENCAVVTSGVYVGLFFSSHYDAMVAAFEAGIA